MKILTFLRSTLQRKVNKSLVHYKTFYSAFKIEISYGGKKLQELIRIEHCWNNLHFTDYFTSLMFINEFESIHTDYEEVGPDFMGKIDSKFCDDRSVSFITPFRLKIQKCVPLN